MTERPYPELAPGQLFLLRHGETEWSRSGRHTGVTDLPLTEEGERRARAVAPVLAACRFDLVLSSPRRRARRTAELAGFGDRVEVDDDLVEFDYGAYEGLTSDQIHEQRPDWDLWRDGTPSGDTPGETPAEVRARVDRVIRRAEPVLEQGRDVLAVAHGHVLRALGAAWIGLPPDGGSRLVLGTAGVAALGHEHGYRVIDLWNVQP
ncbi:histidine phosphatase family protein [Amnibacterium endophyticum]|uniref:Histidine phosphatase family protein n=1 Tax=Amnibacterium endophyticum TaxID=2109337 RepID=A0ABW4LC08_9MICO